MATKQPTSPPDESIPQGVIVHTPAQPTPTEGGSYTVDEQTGEHTLVERTQPAKE